MGFLDRVFPSTTPAATTQKKIVILSGETGVGKSTTLISFVENLLKDGVDPKKIAVISNDADKSGLNFDAQLIGKLPTGFSSVDFGCACCIAFDALKKTIKDVTRNPEIEHIFVELAGTSDHLTVRNSIAKEVPGAELQIVHHDSDTERVPPAIRQFRLQSADVIVAKPENQGTVTHFVDGARVITEALGALKFPTAFSDRVTLVNEHPRDPDVDGTVIRGADYGALAVTLAPWATFAKIEQCLKDLKEKGGATPIRVKGVVGSTGKGFFEINLAEQHIEALLKGSSLSDMSPPQVTACASEGVAPYLIVRTDGEAPKSEYFFSVSNIQQNDREHQRLMRILAKGNLDISGVEERLAHIRALFVEEHDSGNFPAELDREAMKEQFEALVVAKAKYHTQAITDWTQDNRFLEQIMGHAVKLNDLLVRYGGAAVDGESWMVSVLARNDEAIVAAQSVSCGRFWLEATEELTEPLIWHSQLRGLNDANLRAGFKRLVTRALEDLYFEGDEDIPANKVKVGKAVEKTLKREWVNASESVRSEIMQAIAEARGDGNS